MGLAGLIQKVFPQKQSAIREALFLSRPVRNENVKEEQGENGTVRLTAPLVGPSKRVYVLLAKAAKMTPEKSFELEEVGAFVWSHCDGNATVEGIAKKLRERFKMNRLEAETALIAFLQTLGRRGLIFLHSSKKQ